MNRGLAAVVVASMVLTAALTACTNKAAPPPPAPRVVKAMVVSTSDASATRSFGGDIRARHETLAGFRIGGKIIERQVDVGSVVKPGQVLARIDPADLALSAAQADAQASLAVADAKRYRELRDKNFVSQAAVDARNTAQKAAGAQAALARNQAAYAVLTADRAGVVAEVLAQAGQVVAPGQPVLRLAWDGEREVALSIPEDAIADIKVGSEVEISVWSAGGKIIRGRVRELSPIADPATRTFAARVRILDRVDLPLGMSATTSFTLRRAAMVTVPLSGIYQQGEQAAVWIVGSDNKVKLRPVRVASYSDAGARIVDGLAAGERIVIAGVNRLQAGETVTVSTDKP